MGSNDPEPNRKKDPEGWQAWFNRQVASHDEDVQEEQGTGILNEDDDNS